MPHIHYYIDRTVEVFVVYDDKVLLRRHDKYFKWLSVGGHVELNEDFNQAAIREVKEEVGLDVELFYEGKIPLTNGRGYKELVPPQFTNIHRINETHRHETFVYFASSTTNRLVLSEEEKSEECRWFTREDLIDYKRDDLDETIRNYALSALDKLSS